MTMPSLQRTRAALVAAALLAALAPPAAAKRGGRYELNDCHLHLTNYVQEGTDMRAFVRMMGARVGRAAVFGIPLQQQWSYRVSGDDAPTYYLETDAPLYYYSFTDAQIAMAYRALSPSEQARLDPMITGFNPTDMYAIDHIRRVLLTFPGVFSGIGEFTIHKEFVSAKVAGEVASLQDPALDRLLAFAADVGLVVLIHNDLDVPFPKEGAEPAYLEQLVALFKRHPKTTFIWAHGGVGRIVRPVDRHAAFLERLLEDRELRHVYVDLSWTETAKYLVASPESLRISADLLNRHADRFLFGTDEVAPRDQRGYLRIREQYEPLARLLTPETKQKFFRGNYERIFDEARRKVRAWERAQRRPPPR